jgi:hypothetical protein
MGLICQHIRNHCYVFHCIMYFLLLRIFRYYVVIVAMYFSSFKINLFYFYVFIIYF